MTMLPALAQVDLVAVMNSTPVHDSEKANRCMVDLDSNPTS